MESYSTTPYIIDEICCYIIQSTVCLVASIIFSPWTFSSSLLLFSLSFRSSLNSSSCLPSCAFYLSPYCTCVYWKPGCGGRNTLCAFCSFWLPWYAAFVPTTSMSNERTSIIIEQGTKHITLKLFSAKKGWYVFVIDEYSTCTHTYTYLLHFPRWLPSWNWPN